MEDHKTKEILHIMQILGHRRTRNKLMNSQFVELSEIKAMLNELAKKVNAIQKELQE